MSEPASPTESENQRKVLYYRNPMGLADTSPVPRKDSMGMDYVPVYADETASPAGTFRVSLDKVQRAGVETEIVARRPVVRTVHATGTVAADESRLAIVTAKFAGFVQELFVPVTGAEVRADQPLLRVWIESPEILRKQADYLIALRRADERPDDVERAARNLRLFGVPDQAIEDLARTREATRSIVLTAPANGTVIEKPALNGMRFAAGDMLYRTANLSTVWVIAEIAERDLGGIKLGQTARVTLKAYPESPVNGHVAFIYPELTMSSRTVPVRIELPNPDGRFKIGLYGDVTIETPLSRDPVIAIPESAIIDGGGRRIAFVARGEGEFEPRALALGARGGGLVEVRSGLSEGDRIVTRGNFLIDAESNLRSALGTFGGSEAKP